MASAPVMRRKPEARAETVEDLVDRVLHGLLRVPSFQRGLRWNARDVTDLLDSVYRGYPIGSLLLWKRPGEAKRIHMGPLTIDAPETSSTWAVIDGQQRLTALAASLARPEPIPRTPADPYVVYFDAMLERFEAPPVDGNIQSTWVPVTSLLDAARLNEWVLEWSHGGKPSIRRVVFEAGKRLREYPVPLYVVDTEDEGLLREIFYRVNNAGRKLEWSEIHDALFGAAQARPSTIGDLADQLVELGMGRLERDTLLSCLLSLRGLDVTRSLSEHRRRDPDVLKSAVSEGLPVLRRVLAFLRDSAEIPHLRLLPRALPLVVLTRFFALHPEPKNRTRTLLTRWVWRLFLTVGTYDERAILRKGVSAIEAGAEEVSTQRLLRLTPKRSASAFVMPDAFDARAAATRVVLTALASLKPRDLRTGEPMDVASLIEAEQADSFRKIFTRANEKLVVVRTPANRVIHASDGAIGEMLRARLSAGRGQDAVLASHGIGAEAARLLRAGKTEEFLKSRSHELTRLVDEMGQRLAAWSRGDRPSVEHLLGDAGRTP